MLLNLVLFILGLLYAAQILIVVVGRLLILNDIKTKKEVLELLHPLLFFRLIKKEFDKLPKE